MPATHPPAHSAAPQVIPSPLKPASIAGLAHTVPVPVPVLVRVQAPDADPSVTPIRRPYHLSLVIDRSGSMNGQQARFGKESLYSAMKMRSRVTSKDEQHYGTTRESDSPRFLRRDASQGTKGGSRPSPK